MIAIIICAHKNKNQVQRLINRLKHKEIDIYIHIDKKFNVDKFDNAKTLKTRYDVKWGDDTLVNCTIDFLEEVQNKKYSHYIFISGQDYPIVSPDTIVNFFKKHKNTDFLEYAKIGTQPKEWNILNRYNYYRFDNRLLNFISRKLWSKREIFKNQPHYGGSVWWMLTDNSIRYITSQYRKLNLHKKIKHTVCIDEVIIQTILCNSKYKENIVNDNYRYIDWSDHKQGKNDGNPNILTKKDYKKIINSGKFFARKFEETIDSEILDMLDKYIDQNNQEEI